MRFETWERIQKAIDCIRSGKLDELAPGRHELFDGAYINVFEYQTKTEGLYEAHRKYIDIHYLIRGCEIISWRRNTTRKATACWVRLRESPI